MHPFRFFCLYALLCTLFACEAPSGKREVVHSQPEPHYCLDSADVASWGADEYGMKRYVMAFLYAGPNRDRSEEEAAELQRAHLENIDRLAEAGKLVLAGPFLDEGELRGIYVFDVPTVEEAAELTATDPAIQAGSLVMELKPWYGSAALIPLNDLHRLAERRNVTETAGE